MDELIPDDDLIPDVVLADIVGRPNARLRTCHRETVTGSSGAATGEVIRLIGVATADGSEVDFRIIRKTFRPLTTGRHAPFAHDPGHWAYWRREPLAYAGAILPSGPGLAAPRCHGVVEDVVYLAEESGGAESAEVAALRLGQWQAAAVVPKFDWLVADQLGQRIAASGLDWRQVEGDPRMAALWERRSELLDELGRVPRVLVHGDYSAGNLIAKDDRTTVALDWATVGVGPVGADLAGLALSTRRDLLDVYLTGLGRTFDRSAVETGYRATLALVGASRVHWMLSQGIEPGAEYLDFVASQAP